MFQSERVHGHDRWWFGFAAGLLYIAMGSTAAPEGAPQFRPPQAPRGGVTIGSTASPVTVRDKQSHLDSHGCFHYEAVASVAAPLNAVFDVLVHQERLAALGYSLRLLSVEESKDHRTRF